MLGRIEINECSGQLVDSSNVAYQNSFQRAVWIAVGAILLIAFFIALLAHAYIGLFSRFLADEYCTAGVVQTYGFFGAQKYWFTTWTGRFSFTLAISLAHLIGAKLVPFLPGI